MDLPYEILTCKIIQYESKNSKNFEIKNSRGWMEGWVCVKKPLFVMQGLRLTHVIFLNFRVPQPYQYSALSQFDNDPDEEMNDLDDHLEMLVEDSSSEDLDEEEVKNEQKEIKATDTNEVRTKKFTRFLGLEVSIGLFWFYFVSF